MASHNYICNGCGMLFDTPLTYAEQLGPGVSDVERTDTCPRCGGNDFETAFECEICGAAISESQNEFKLCAICETRALERFLRLVCALFDQNERAYLDACIEGHSLTEPSSIKAVMA